MKQSTIILIAVGAVVIIGGGFGAWWFFFKKTTPTATTAAGAALTQMPSAEDLNTLKWRNTRQGVIVPTGLIASVDPDGTVHHRDTAWIGKLVRNGKQINWTKNNGEEDIWNVVA